MGILSFRTEKDRHLKRIKLALQRRNLVLSKDEEWEVHGPHERMNYQVYVGPAYREMDPNARCNCPSTKSRYTHCKAHRQDFCVVIDRKTVYQVEDRSDWWKYQPENRIFTIR